MSTNRLPVRPSDRSFARRIDLTSLQLFVAVCEFGSIGKAAERDLEEHLSTEVLHGVGDLAAAA